ncbi:MAG TPA: hypothetical protein VHO46_13945 [Bacteroidales bacterium]|nr:hypothetical protein [Bacteroidales bacterium]
MKELSWFRSFVAPVVIEVSGSELNPFLSVELDCGKYVLNSTNANYSYGSLHTLFKKTFIKIKPDWSLIRRALILGFGTGCVAETIHTYNSDCKIDGVEPDQKIIDLGIKYFNTNDRKNLTIHNDSAERFIKSCNEKYDLIIIDVYIDLNVPPEIETEQFLTDVRNALNQGGIVIFNKFITTRAVIEQIPVLKELYEKIFTDTEILRLMTTGRMFIARK